ncbi:hypothetical protein AAC387_Pa07g0007 [Persea americana]
MIRSNSGKTMKEPIIITSDPCWSGQQALIPQADLLVSPGAEDTVIVAEKNPQGLTRALSMLELDEGVPKMTTSLPVRKGVYGCEKPLNCQVSKKRPRDGDMLEGGFNQVRLHGEEIPTDPKASTVAHAWNGYMRRQMIRKEFEGAVT